MKFRLQNLERIYKQIIMLFVDVATLLFALWLAFVLRLGVTFTSHVIMIQLELHGNCGSNICILRGGYLFQFLLL